MWANLLPLLPVLAKHNIFQNMLIINVKDNESIDKALKRFKKKFEKTGVLRQLRSRTAFKKPSVKRRMEVIKATYKERMYGNHTEQ
jgi:small subunit ribosomal protein S21